MKRPLLLAGFLAFSVQAANDAQPFAVRRAALEAAWQTNRLNGQILFQLGHLCHQQAITGDSEAVKLAEQYLTELKRVEPTNAFGQALLGSTTVMKARDAFLPTTKLKWVRQGCAVLDAAAKMASEDPNVRFTRASNNLFLPDLCGRKEIVRQDFEWLSARALDGPSTLPQGFRQYVALYHGIALRKWGDLPAAKAKWKMGLTLAPDSPVAAEIQAAMKEADAHLKN